MTAIVVMGVSGSGKSTVGALLAAELGWRFVDGDALHPATNTAKMAAGVPLTDADRWPWLDAVGAVANSGTDVVVACSGLRRAYRDRLRPAHLVHLDCSRTVLADRLAARVGHFFGPELLDSQLRALEPPHPDEAVLRVDAAREPTAVTDAIRAGLTAVRD